MRTEVNELVRTHLKALQSIRKTPELSLAFRLVEVEPKFVSQTFGQYRRAVKTLVNLTETDVEQIAQVNRTAGQTRGADYFLTQLGDENGKQLLQIVDASTNPLSRYYYKTAVSELCLRIQKAQEYRGRIRGGEMPKDGDTTWDSIIWGYLLIHNPNEHLMALRHFVIGHYLERFVSGVLRAHNVPMAHDKDFFLNALSDVIAYSHSQGRGNKDQYDIWSTPKHLGGLGWISPQTLQAYRAI
jgi:hypothetical protein